MRAVKDLFLELISYDTESIYDLADFPSTKTQLEFAEVVADECRKIGLDKVKISEHGYVTALLPSNTDKKVETVGFLAHMDTSPDYSGKNIKPQIIPDYDGKPIKLNNELTLSPNEFPHLSNYIGNELITTSGDTLLGADNKAGIAEILTAMKYLIDNPQIKRGNIAIGFTPDEEVGRGADFFDVEDFGADFAFTIDGGEIGELEYENFNAAEAKINITGKSVHPGNAKDIMINASLIAFELADKFPQNETPGTTEGYEGFYHLTDMEGSVSKAYLKYIIRDFDKDNFNKRKDFILDIVTEINNKYKEDIVQVNLVDSYFNMKEILDDKMHIVDLAKRAMEKANVVPIIKPIRGGTDGSRLSFMGLPCPNIFTGGHNFHGPYEYISVESMIKACETIVNICKLTTEK